MLKPRLPSEEASPRPLQASGFGALSFEAVGFTRIGLRRLRIKVRETSQVMGSLAPAVDNGSTDVKGR